MDRATGFALARLGIGLLGLTAVVTEIATLVERGVFVAHNFFSYFTIQSNLAVALFLILYAAFGRSGRTRDDRVVQTVRGGLTLDIAMTGVIFSVLPVGGTRTPTSRREGRLGECPCAASFSPP